MAPTRREFLVRSSLLLAAAGCGIQRSGQGVETFGARVVAGRQVLDGTLSIATERGALPPVLLDSFRNATGVVVRTQYVARDNEFIAGLAAGAAGSVDNLLVGDDVLAAMIARDLLEPLDTSLVPGRGDVSAPFSDPPADPGMRHSVPQDFFTIGYAVLDAAPLHDATWAGFFQLARANPGQVDVPDDPTTVIGAALVSLGHDWNSDSDGDLDDAAALLQELKSAVVIAPAPRRVGRRGALAAMAPSLDYVGARPPVTYVVPGDGTVARVRSWCIPILAPHPVSAHAWLANVIDPTTAAATVLATRRPSPVQSVPDRLPASMLLDPALYPPDDLSGELVFQHLSGAGVQRRHQIWAALRG